MIVNYDEFILEQILSMINESQVFYSRDFKKLLNDIESPVAKALLKIESGDYKVASNFFDISDNKDTISFIADRKAQEFIRDTENKFVKVRSGHILTHGAANKTIFEILGYEPDGESQGPDSDEVCEVVAKAVSPTSGKTYLHLKFNDGKCVINQEYVEYVQNDDVWKKNRQTIRVGRGIKALLVAAGEKFTDAEIEDFVNKYKSAFDRKNDIFRHFDLVTGEDISSFYHYNNYFYGTQRGTLGNSCMASVPRSYFEIYTKNPEVCSLLILRSETNKDKIIGRALVWKLTEPKDVIFMDRVYYTEDSQLQLFRDYAKQKGWFAKRNNDSSPEAEVYTPEGKIKEFDFFAVKINSIDYNKFPYVDTLKFFYDWPSDFNYWSPPTLSTKEDSDAKLLESTGGGYEGGCENCDNSGRVSCYRCDGDGNESCDKCDGNGNITCSKCDGNETVECRECDGDGKIDGETCTDCDGNGEVKCKECEGEGVTDCDDCDGRGLQECGRCDGRGEVDCPECN
jgi:hypothetical protein